MKSARLGTYQPALPASLPHCRRQRCTSTPHAIGQQSLSQSTTHPLHLRQQLAAPRPRREAWRAAAAPELPDLDALLGDLDLPEIDADLASLQTEQGAVFDDEGVVVHFRNDARAMHAVENKAALFDRSHWGRLRLAGEGRLAFLHGQSTADTLELRPGQGCDTVFVTAQARTLDLATVYAQGSGLLIVTSPGMREKLRQRLDKYIFPADQVTLEDVSAKTAMFSLVGPGADAVLRTLRADDLCDAPAGNHRLLSFQGKPVIVAAGGGLPGPGYTFIADESVAADLWRVLTSQEGVVPAGRDVWEMARVLAGRPAPGAELTEQYNPLEAGLYHAVSLQKGCYIGQETIAKVHNLDAVKQQLWLLEMETPCAVGDEVAAAGGGAALGRVTSYVDTPDSRHRALAYLRCKSSGAQIDLEGLAVEVAGAKGRVVAPPFLSRALPEGQGGPAGSAAPASARELAVRQAEARRQREEEAAAAAAAREERLRAMQERLDAWQAQQAEAEEAFAAAQEQEAADAAEAEEAAAAAEAQAEAEEKKEKEEQVAAAAEAAAEAPVEAGAEAEPEAEAAQLETPQAASSPTDNTAAVDTSFVTSSPTDNTPTVDTSYSGGYSVGGSSWSSGDSSGGYSSGDSGGYSGGDSGGDSGGCD